jgi:hypothetical protein
MVRRRPRPVPLFGIGTGDRSSDQSGEGGCRGRALRSVRLSATSSTATIPVSARVTAVGGPELSTVGVSAGASPERARSPTHPSLSTAAGMTCRRARDTASANILSSSSRTAIKLILVRRHVTEPRSSPARAPAFRQRSARRTGVRPDAVLQRGDDHDLELQPNSSGGVVTSTASASDCGERNPPAPRRPTPRRGRPVPRCRAGVQATSFGRCEESHHTVEIAIGLIGGDPHWSHGPWRTTPSETAAIQASHSSSSMVPPSEPTIR